VAPPPPPLIRELLQKPMQENKEIQLNIDVPTMVGKMNMIVRVTEMCKIPSMRREVLNLLKVLAEAEDPLIIMKTVYLGWKNNPNPPLYLSLGMNNLVLQNYMLDYGASTNVMSLKFMKQLGLEMTQP
jgi:sialic acid synthase SpsE